MYFGIVLLVNTGQKLEFLANVAKFQEWYINNINCPEV